MQRVEALVKQTIEALGTWDAAALERLAAEAEACRDQMQRTASAPLQLAELHQTLGAALASTGATLRTLRGLSGHLHREDTPWVR